jgi:hydrogenase maturation protease
MANVIIGVGSPHGNDAIGWRVVEGLQMAMDERVAIRAVMEPTQLLDHLDGCTNLWIVDACRCGQSQGEITRWAWPEDTREIARDASSTHTMSLPAVLELAAALGKLPERIVIFAVEIGSHALVGEEMCDEVAAAAMELVERVREEVSAAQNSPTPALR